MKFKQKLKNQKGQTIMEYVIISSLIGLVCLATVKGFGGTIEKKISVLKRHINKELSLQ